MKTRLDNKTIWCYIEYNNKPNYERRTIMTDKKLRNYLKKEIKRLEKLIASYEDDKEVYHYFTGKKEAYENLLEIV